MGSKNSGTIRCNQYSNSAYLVPLRTSLHWRDKWTPTQYRAAENNKRWTGLCEHNYKAQVVPRKLFTISKSPQTPLLTIMSGCFLLYTYPVHESAKNELLMARHRSNKIPETGIGAANTFGMFSYVCKQIAHAQTSELM